MPKLTHDENGNIYQPRKMVDGVYYAVIAVDNICSNGYIIDWAENVPSSIKDLESENNWLGKTEFKAVECGMYVARLFINELDAEWAIIIDNYSLYGYEIIRVLNETIN